MQAAVQMDAFLECMHVINTNTVYYKMISKIPRSANAISYNAEHEPEYISWPDPSEAGYYSYVLQVPITDAHYSRV